jgi:hypothetical protein
LVRETPERHAQEKEMLGTMNNIKHGDRSAKACDDKGLSFTKS